MEKINFQDYPSTDTPINSTNLNTLQNNVETELEKLNLMFKIQTFDGSAYSVPANNGQYTFTISITVPTGYKILCTQHYYVSGGASGYACLGPCRFNENVFSLSVVNPTSVARSWTPYVSVVFVKENLY